LPFAVLRCTPRISGLDSAVRWCDSDSSGLAERLGSNTRRPVQDYRKLKVWQKAHKLTLDVYAVSASLVAPAAWPLRNQLLRAAISVPSNIAEGAGRRSDPDFKRFLAHSLGSLNEVEYDLLLARDLGFVRTSDHLRLSRQLEEVRRMLSGLMAEVGG
jgi:four helix bundle protein